MAHRVGDHHRLLGDFLGHEMGVAGLVGGGGFQLYLAHLAIGTRAVCIENLGPGAGDQRPVALLQIGDFPGHRCQRQRVRADIHLALSMPDCKGRAFARRDQQIILALNQKAQRKRPVQPRNGGCRRLFGALALIKISAKQQGHGLGVGLGLKAVTFFGQLLAQLAKILDNAVMDHSNLARLMGMGVINRRRAMGGPARVADAHFTAQRLVYQQVREVD